jgi:hypothetical protein
LKFEKYSTAKFESGLLATKLSTLLNQSFFKQISRPSSLKLNSPVLQRKSGYREVLNAWLKFDLAAKLIWQGGENVYDAGKKDIATLYEYWLFFTLLDLLKEVFEIEPKSIAELIQFDKGQLSLNLKQGTAIAMKGVYKSPSRNLNIQFSYNRSFGGGKTFPNSGSYTTTLRPDYTLSIWPEEIIEAKDAERTELITHIHFDAKYKVKNFYELISKSKDEELTEEENIELIKEEAEEVKKGTFKNQDLLKMHAYKDAIRRTGGAYVLYPGDKAINQKGFHEIIPGLGAFPVKPSKTDNGISELKAFILEIIEHFINRASQREKFAQRTYDIFKTPPDNNNIIKESLPETFGTNRNLIPDETFVLIGFYKSTAHLNWIKKRNLYNFRMDGARGALILSYEAVTSKYLLLHTFGQKESGELWKIVSSGFRLLSKKTMERLNYPSPSNPNYLILKIEKVSDSEFENVRFDFTKLKNYATGRASSFPFTASIAELMRCKMK